MKMAPNFCNLIEVLITSNFVELTDNHCDAHADVEHLGKVLSTGGQIHTTAVDKIRSSTQQEDATFCYYAIRFLPKNVHWLQICRARD